MSTLADAMLAWKAKLTTKVTPEQVLTLRSDVNVFVDDVRFLESENAKLRELCETFGMIANDAVCDYYERDEMLEQANADARELGIEVD